MKPRCPICEGKCSSKRTGSGALNITCDPCNIVWMCRDRSALRHKKMSRRLSSWLVDLAVCTGLGVLIFGVFYVIAWMMTR